MSFFGVQFFEYFKYLKSQGAETRVSKNKLLTKFKYLQKSHETDPLRKENTGTYISWNIGTL